MEDSIHTILTTSVAGISPYEESVLRSRIQKKATGKAIHVDPLNRKFRNDNFNVGKYKAY